MSCLMVQGQEQASAVDYYRTLLPAHQCGVDVAWGVNLSLLREYQNVIVTRLPTEAFLHLLEAYKKRGGRVIWNIDDDFLNLPEGHISKPVFEYSRPTIGRMMHLADELILSVPELQDVYRDMKVTVLPNLVDDSAFLGRQKNHKVRPVVLWTGSDCHTHDLAQIQDAVDWMVDKLDMQFVFFGYLPDTMSQLHHQLGQMPLAKYGDKVLYVPPVPFEYYHSVLRWIDADISLCPLLDCRFNLGKSAIKFLETTLSGACCICSDMPCYSDSIVKVEEHEWFAAVKYLLANEQMRDEVVMANRDAVLSKHSWRSEGRQKWVDFFAAL